jgi:hypothetical protein
MSSVPSFPLLHPFFLSFSLCRLEGSLHHTDLIIPSHFSTTGDIVVTETASCHIKHGSVKTQGYVFVCCMQLWRENQKHREPDVCICPPPDLSTLYPKSRYNLRLGA